MKKLLLCASIFVVGCVENGAALTPPGREAEKDKSAIFARKTKSESDFERSLATLLEKAESNCWDQSKTIDACIELSREYGVDGWKFKQVLLGVIVGFVITGGVGLVLAAIVMDGIFS